MSNITRLLEYAEHEGSELGEAYKLLIEICTYKDYLTKDFINAAVEEVKDQLNWCDWFFEWKERKVTTTTLIKELVAKNEVNDD